MRMMLLIPGLGLMAACNTVAPVSGTGFNTPDYQAQREAQLAGQGASGNPLLPPPAISQEQLTAGAAGPAVPYTTSDGASDIANQTAAALASTSGQVATPGIVSTTGLSDEQDFAAVSNRRSIEDDAALLRQNQQTYEVVAPTAVPQRGQDGQPNIVQYALSSTNPVGTQLYSRAGFNLQAKAQRNCAQYASPDQAQIAFLSSGGPQRDRKGLDPDGDGFACGWDPSPFRSSVNN